MSETCRFEDVHFKFRDPFGEENGKFYDTAFLSPAGL